MSSTRDLLIRSALCCAPFAFIVACASETAPPADIESAAEAYTAGPPAQCAKRDPYSSVNLFTDQDPKDVELLAKLGCKPRFQYLTGGQAGIIEGIMSVCEDTDNARKYVTSVYGSWAPIGFCDFALDPLPKGERYVAWRWAIGPNCSGCRIGIIAW